MPSQRNQIRSSESANTTGSIDIPRMREGANERYFFLHMED